MFGIGELERFDDRHRIVIADTFHALRDKYPKVFVQVADISSVELYWNSYLDVDNGVLGWFRWYVPDRIELSTAFRYNMPGGEEDTSIRMIMPTICHELHHRFQLFTRPCRYFPGLLLRRLIENSANKVEREVEDIMNQEYS